MTSQYSNFVLPLDCIAFFNGDPVPMSILDEAVACAREGYITEAGMRLYLIPRKHYENAQRIQQAKADEYARRRRKKDPGFKSGDASPSIKISDCISLSSFLPKDAGSEKARLCESSPMSPLIPRLPQGVKRNAHREHCVLTKRNASCLNCGEILIGKRSDAKYCSKACKQADYRMRGGE